MEAKELRLGNYISVKAIHENDYVAGLVEVTGLTEDGVNFRFEDPHSGFQYWLKDCEPIHLTEEWLVKFGFEKSDDRNNYDSHHVIPFSYIEKRNEEPEYVFDSWALCNADGLEVIIDSVHQLQNICYALTGEELTVKK